jgi:hypothetical protein
LQTLRFVDRALGLAVGLYVFFFAGATLANGRYPLSQQLLVDPTDGAHLVLRSTYGVLTSPDTGATWSWLCEGGIGYDPGEDPMMAIAGDGSVLAAASEGLFVSTDRGCTWPKPMTLDGLYVRDLATEKDAAHVLAVTVQVEKDGKYTSAIFRSPDSARTWAPLGALGVASSLPFTLDVAPSDPERVYLSTVVFGSTTDGGVADAGAIANSEGHGVLLRSSDGGATWQSRPIPGTTRDVAPYIAAVHPTRPDTLFVRVRGDSNNTDPVESWLLYTDDAGDTWKEVFRAKADMLGFALTPGADSVLVGMGDTRDANRLVDTAVLGLYRSPLSAFSFAQGFHGQIGCLTYSGSTLYVCGGQEADGFELGVSSDDGVTLTPLFEYGAVAGPLTCPADSAQAKVCDPQWQYTCRGLGVCPHVDAGVTPTTPSRSSSSGCCGSASASSSTPQTGTAHLDMLEDPTWLAAGTFLAGLLRRRFRPKNARPS